MIDPFGRKIDYLRISVTDRCNLRCRYCMPPEGIPWKPSDEILAYEEIVKFVTIAAQMGVRWVRLTGGEPLVRRDLPFLVAALAGVPGIEEVTLTTNGILLEKFARSLADAGLKRVNVSLDTLDAEKFKRITRGGEIDCVWQGIAAAEAAHLHPIKINTVVTRGVNDDELIALANLAREHPWHVRFIELMPIGDSGDWGPGFHSVTDRYLSVGEMREILSPLGFYPAKNPPGNGPAKSFEIPGGLGTIGFISPLGEHFCDTCNRLRLTADGRLRPCLLSDLEIDIRDALRRKEPLERLLLQAISFKPRGHGLNRLSTANPQSAERIPSRFMAQIGG